MRIIAIALILLIILSFRVNAREFEEHKQDAYTGNTMDPLQIHSMIATAYCIHGITATQTQTRLGIAAGKPEWFGKTAKVYRNDNGHMGDLIGEYIIEDTGGKAIRNGSVIDIWMETESECFAFGRQLVYVIIVD